MSSKRQNSIHEITTTISNNSNSTILVNGQFGIGKSEFVKILTSEIFNKRAVDAIISFNFDIENDYLAQYLKSINITFPDSEFDSINYNFNETMYNEHRLNELLTGIKKNKELSKTIDEHLKLVYYPDLLKESALEIDSAFNEALSTEIETKGDRRLILENGRVQSESLIVDLMNLFYPITPEYDSYEKYLNDIKSPIRLCIIIDNIDKIAWSMLHWIDSQLIPISTKGRFKEFVTYSFQNDQDILINQFFDISFVVSTRINTSDLKEFVNLSRNNSSVHQYKLEPFDLEELTEYIRNNGASYNGNIEELMKLSYGIPYFVDLWLDAFNLGYDSSGKTFIYQKITDKIFDCKTPEQIEAIICASFCESFDEQILRVFPQLNKVYKNAFKFLEFTNDMVVNIDGQLKFTEPYKEIINTASRINSQKTVENIEKIIKLYLSVRSNFKKLTQIEFNILRNLAYFNYFDVGLALDRAYEEDAPAARNFITKYPEYFEKNLYTFRLKENHKHQFQQLNKLLDKDKFEDKRKFIEYIWNNYKSEMTAESSEIKAKLNELEGNLNAHTGKSSVKKNTYEDHQRVFIEKENELISIRKEIEEYSPAKNLTTGILNVSAGIIAIFVSYFFPDLFQTHDNHSSIIIIQYILYFCSLVFTILGLYYFQRATALIMKKKEINELKVKLKNVEDEKMLHQEEMSLLRDNKKNHQRRYTDINDQIKALNSRMNELQEKQKFPYI